MFIGDLHQINEINYLTIAKPKVNKNFKMCQKRIKRRAKQISIKAKLKNVTAMSEDLIFPGIFFLSFIRDDPLI